MRTSTLITALFVAVLCGFAIQTAEPPPFHGVGIFATVNGSIQTSSNDFFANLPTRSLTLATAAPPPTLTPVGLPLTLSTFVFPDSAMPPALAPPVETVTITATNVSTTATMPSSNATTDSLSTSSSSSSSSASPVVSVPVTTITVSPLPASPSAKPTGNSYTSASETTSDLGVTTSPAPTPLTTTASGTGAGKRKSLSRAQKIAAIVAPILGLLLVAIAVFIGYWLRTRRQERQRADRLEQRARWFRQDHNDWIRAQMSSFDETKVGGGRNSFATPPPSSGDTICRPRTRPRQFSGSTVVVNRPEEAVGERVVRRRGAVENLRG